MLYCRQSVFQGRVYIFFGTCFAYSKGNRTELEKVLYYYQQDATDSLKYKAACFLIENMPYHSYTHGEQLEKYKKYYAWLKDSHGKTPEEVADSVKKHLVQLDS